MYYILCIISTDIYSSALNSLLGKLFIIQETIILEYQLTPNGNYMKLLIRYDRRSLLTECINAAEVYNFCLLT